MSVNGRTAGAMMFVAAHRATETNISIVNALRRHGTAIVLVPPQLVAEHARAGDVVLARLDVLPTLDGVEPGLWQLRALEHRGIRVLNPAAALLASHDKLATSLRLARAGVPHPRTANVDGNHSAIRLELPVVVKPRFGSWGRDVFLCKTADALERRLRELHDRRWFARHGAIVQELIPHGGSDLRLVIAGGRVVGAVERVAAAGEWRTNIALGARRIPVISVPADAAAVAVDAAAAVAGDLVGVDLVARPSGEWLVLEINGAVDFTLDYSLPGRRVFDDVARGVLDAWRHTAVAVH
jgi:RimK family alpha-L-glutamate ligase